MEDYKVVERLGSGGQGVTYKALRNVDRKTVVIKYISCENIKRANAALQEAKVLQRLSHANVVKYEDVCLDEVNDEMIPGKKKLRVCIVMELCEMGDLTAYLMDMRNVKRSVVSETEALDWIEQMSSALAYIHGEKTLHRDLKPLNIFISRNSVKLGDFGLARQIVPDPMSQVGTPCYCSPEVLNSELYAESADIWGLGCIALELLSLKFLWEGTQGFLAFRQPITADYMTREYMPELRQCVAGATPGDNALFHLECMHV
jgi:serine/threonine protein kinase